MNKLATFARTYLKSISEPAYYREVVEAKLSFSLKYFFFFFLVLGLCSTLLFSYRTLPKLKSFTTHTIQDINTYYPPQLELNFESNSLTVTGADQPLNVPFPQELHDFARDMDFDHLLTINDSADSAAPGTFLTLGKDAVYVRQPDNTKQTFLYSDLEADYTIDKNVVGLATSALQTRLTTLLNYLPYLVLLFLIIFRPLFSLITVAFYAFFIYLATGVSNRYIGYKKSFQLGLHLITFAATTHFFQNLLFPNLPLPSLFSIAFLGAALFAIYSLRPHAPPAH